MRKPSTSSASTNHKPMKKISLFLICITFLVSCGQTKKQKSSEEKTTSAPKTTVPATAPQTSASSVPWTKDELMPPEVLAQKIEQGQTDNLLILSIGFENLIKGSIDLGPAENQAAIKELKDYLSDVPKDQNIVIYCGCCPFEKCPNIRPAFSVLNKMGFTNAKLLNLTTSIKADWLDKGYPIQKGS